MSKQYSCESCNILDRKRRKGWREYFKLKKSSYEDEVDMMDIITKLVEKNIEKKCKICTKDYGKEELGITDCAHVFHVKCLMFGGKKCIECNEDVEQYRPLKKKKAEKNK